MIRIGVLRGGTSTDNQTSLLSGAHILSALPRDRFEPVDIFIDRAGVWHMGGRAISSDTLKHRVDVIWNALNGFYGSDGKVQLMLEQLGLPYVGSSAVPSAIASNNKLLRKRLAQEKIHMPLCLYVEDWGTGDKFKAVAGVAREVMQKLSPPWILKPISQSYGMTALLAKTRDELATHLAHMQSLDIPIVIEQMVVGREAKVVSIPGFRGQKNYTLLPQDDARSHKAFSSPEKIALQKLAAHIHDTLGLGHYSQLHAVVHPRGKIYVIAVESQPAMDGDSALLAGLAHVGSSMDEFIRHVLG